MTKRKKSWLIVISLAVGLAFIGLVIAAQVAHRIDPYIRQQAILYFSGDSRARSNWLRSTFGCRGGSGAPRNGL